MATVTKTITLNPSGYTGSTNISISSSYPITNAYHGIDSENYARLSISTSSTGYLYLTINTSDIPSDATNVSISAKARVRVSNTTRVTNTQCQLFTGTTAKGSNVTFASTSTTNVVTLSTGSSWTRSELNDLRMKVGGTGSSSSSSKYIYFYGADITISYDVTACTVTSTLTGNGTIDPSGETAVAEGDEYTLTITPTTKTDTVTATKDGVDITSQLVAHGAGSTVTVVPANVTTSSIQSGASYAQYAIGHSAESPYSSTSNMYAASGSTGYAAYSFDFSGIPSNATIENIEVRCHGHRESATISSTYVSKCALYNSNTEISAEVNFPSTTASIITLEPNVTVTRSMLDNLTVRHFVGYYGGLVTGISFEVEYSTGTGIDHYTYTYTVNADATIAVTIGGGGGDTSKIYVKLNGSWVEVTPYKKVNGSWVLQTDVTNVFDSSKKYIKGS